MMLLHLLFFVYCVGFCHGTWSYSLESALREAYFTNNSYNKAVRPDDTVVISISFSMFSVNELNIVSQSLEVSGYFQVIWVDQRLSWKNDLTYKDNISSIFTTDDETWIPGLIIMDSVDSLEVWDDDIPIRVVSSGRVIWNHLGTFKPSCDSDVTYYPFDTQTCDMVITSWTYTHSELTLIWDTMQGESLNRDFYSVSGEWEYISYTTSKTSVTRSVETYDLLTLSITFRRRPVFQLINTILPCICLAFLGCFVFQLPADSGEKVGYVLTVLLAYAVYLTLVSTSMPTTSVNTSVLSVYLIITLICGIVSALMTIVVLKCHHASDEKEIPAWLKKLARGLLSRGCECRKTRTVSDTPEVEEVMTVNDVLDVEKKIPVRKEKPEEKELTWTELSEILDAFFFRTFFIFSVFYQTVFMTVFVVGYFIH